MHTWPTYAEFQLHVDRVAIPGARLNLLSSTRKGTTFLPVLMSWELLDDQPAFRIVGVPEGSPRLVLPEYLREHRPYCHVFIADAWISSDVERLRAGHRPSSDPRRRESLVICARHPEGRQLITIGYDRAADGTITFHPEQRDDHHTLTELYGWAFDTLDEAARHDH